MAKGRAPAGARAPETAYTLRVYTVEQSAARLGVSLGQLGEWLLLGMVPAPLVVGQVAFYTHADLCSIESGLSFPGSHLPSRAPIAEGTADAIRQAAIEVARRMGESRVKRNKAKQPEGDK